jgi:2-amino-4-hydroxy-6-hydroxymethyldihydropteridine diphosphokinase
VCMLEAGHAGQPAWQGLPAGQLAWTAYIGMGGNLGDVPAALSRALDGLAAQPGVHVVGMSPLYRSTPVDAQGPDYINAVAELRCCLGPHELLACLMRLEREGDRQRPYRSAPRTLDLDVLWFGGHACHDDRLTLPHPRMLGRAFVLAPLMAWLAQGGRHLSEACPDVPWPDEAAVAELAKIQGLWPV